jgi:hypothetical protein
LKLLLIVPWISSLEGISFFIVFPEHFSFFCNHAPLW